MKIQVFFLDYSRFIPENSRLKVEYSSFFLEYSRLKVKISRLKVENSSFFSWIFKIKTWKFKFSFLTIQDLFLKIQD